MKPHYFTKRGVLHCAAPAGGSVLVTQDALRKAVLKERERCVKVCENAAKHWSILKTIHRGNVDLAKELELREESAAICAKHIMLTVVEDEA